VGGTDGEVAVIPVWAKPAAIGVAIGLVILLAWIWWPAPGPSPAEKALREQNEALVKANEQLAADAAAKTEEASQLREDANAKLQEIGPIRARRRAARADGARRRDALASTPDGELASALRVQHDRARRALDAVRPAPEPSPSVTGQPQPR